MFFSDFSESEDVEYLGSFLASYLFQNSSEYWAEKLSKDIVVISDEDFADFCSALN